MMLGFIVLLCGWPGTTPLPGIIGPPAIGISLSGPLGPMPMPKSTGTRLGAVGCVPASAHGGIVPVGGGVPGAGAPPLLGCCGDSML